jgi:hypothetical protein
MRPSRVHYACARTTGLRQPAGLPGRDQRTHLFQVALDPGDQRQSLGLRVRLLLARCRIPVRDHLADLLAPEGALLVSRELDAEALAKQALIEPISCLMGSRLDDERRDQRAVMLGPEDADVAKHIAQAPESRPRPVMLLRVDGLAELLVFDLRAGQPVWVCLPGIADEERAHALLDRAQLLRHCWTTSPCHDGGRVPAYDLSVGGGIFLLSGEELVEMREQAYDSEELLQALLARYPDLLAGDQLAGSPRRWLLVKREAGVPDREAGGRRWSLDHLFIDQEAVPTLVEVKRSDDTRIRREVVGQMLDYAANGVVYWPAERLRSDFEARCAKEGKDAEEVFRESLGDELDPEWFWG